MILPGCLGSSGKSSRNFGKDGSPVKKLLAFLLTFGMICGMGVSVGGCKKDDKKADTKKTDDKKDDKKTDDKKA